MPIDREKCGQSLLELSRQGTCPILLRQLLRRGFLNMLDDIWILSDTLRQVPEFQIHLRRWIMRETTQHHLPLLRFRKVAQQPARNSLAPQSNGQCWRYPADDMYKVLDKTLRSSQAIFALEAGCDEIRGP